MSDDIVERAHAALVTSSVNGPVIRELIAEIERLRTDRDYWRNKHRIPTNGCVCRFSDPEDGDELVAECEHHKGVREDLEAEVERLRDDNANLRGEIEVLLHMRERREAPTDGS